MTLVSPATETTNRSLQVLWKRGKNCVPLKGGKDPLAGRGFARLSAHVHFVEIKEDETS